MAMIAPSQPIISFTFDDFPRSALHVAGCMLAASDIRATYYTSFGLMGTTAPTGEIFLSEDLAELVRQGHELGCHTFDHYHSWDTPPAEFEASIRRNRETLTRLVPGAQFGSLSYPISNARPGTKRRIAKYFPCARAGGQTFIFGPTDLNHLNAFFIEQSRDHPDAILRIIDDTIRNRAWLVLATHDVCGCPTRYGCTPELFRQIVDHARASGAAILPVSEALSAVTR
jgi:peptidoglycan/xylan/chitin deacetylase (PgdA/CDA1 family)